MKNEHIENPRHTEGERDCGFADPAEAEFGPREAVKYWDSIFDRILGDKEKKMTTKEFASSLRMVADFYDKHPDMPMPNLTDNALVIYSVTSREELRDVARMFGTFEKESDGSFYSLKKRFGSLFLRAVWGHDEVCIRRVVGTEVKAEEVPTEFKTVEREVEVVEWDCPPIFAKGAGQ